MLWVWTRNEPGYLYKTPHCTQFSRLHVLFTFQKSRQIPTVVHFKCTYFIYLYRTLLLHLNIFEKLGEGNWGSPFNYIPTYLPILHIVMTLLLLHPMIPQLKWIQKHQPQYLKLLQLQQLLLPLPLKILIEVELAATISPNQLKDNFLKNILFIIIANEFYYFYDMRAI